MKLINLADMLAVAKKNKFGVGSFNAIDDHFVDSIFAAAEQNNSPFILSFAEVHSRYVVLEDIANHVHYRMRQTNAPVTLNLDHGVSLSMVERAINAGFTSVMFDGSHLTYEENVRQTAEVVKMCSGKNISVEGELGSVGGDEGGALEGSADASFFTDINQAKDFVSSTGISALAVAIGNSHGRYKGVPKLDFERLASLEKTVDVPLVLHGGSGLSTYDFKHAIELGIAKVNFYTGMSQAALDTLASHLNDEELSQKYDHYLLLTKEVEKSITRVVSEQINIFGSNNKAGLYV